MKVRARFGDHHPGTENQRPWSRVHWLARNKLCEPRNTFPIHSNLSKTVRFQVTAGFWAKRGTLERPPLRQSLSDYVGVLYSKTPSNKLTSGADEQLGMSHFPGSDTVR